MPAWSGFWNHVHTGGHSLAQTVTAPERRLNRVLSSGVAGRKLRATLLALTGSAVGQSKAVSTKRVPHSTGSFPFQGKKTAESRNVQTGVTTAGDLTRMDLRIAKSNKPTTYPVNKSGYGGVRTGKAY